MRCTRAAPTRSGLQQPLPNVHCAVLVAAGSAARQERRALVCLSLAPRTAIDMYFAPFVAQKYQCVTLARLWTGISLLYGVLRSSAAQCGWIERDGSVQRISEAQLGF